MWKIRLDEGKNWWRFKNEGKQNNKEKETKKMKTNKTKNKQRENRHMTNEKEKKLYR